MKREAFKAVGNPLLMGGPVLFVRDLGGGGALPSPPVNLTPPKLVLLNDTTLEYTRGTWAGTPPITFEAELEINGSFVRVVEPGLIPIEAPWLSGSALIWELATNAEGSDYVGAGPVQLPAPPPLAAVLMRVDRGTFSSSFDVLVTGGTTPIVMSTNESGSFVDQQTIGNSWLPFPVIISRLGINSSVTSVTARFRDGLGASVDVPVNIELAPPSGAWPALSTSGGGASPTVRTIAFGGASVDPAVMKFRITLTDGPVPHVPIADVPVPVGTTREQAASLCLAAIQAAAASISGLSARIDAGDPATVIVEGASPITAVSAQAFIVTQQPTPSLDDQVQAILAGTGGYALDPKDISTLFQDDLGATPVTAPGQTVARIVGKWGSPAVWNTNIVSRRLVWDGSNLIFDGVDDFLDGNEAADPSQAAPAMFFCGKLNAKDVAATRGILGISVPTATQSRFVVLVDTTNRVQIPSRRPDGSGITPIFNTPLFPVGEDVVLSCLADVAGASEAYAQINGVRSAPFDLGTPAPYSDTASTRRRLGSHITNTPLVFSGKMGRVIVCPFVPTEAEWTTFEAWAAA